MLSRQCIISIFLVFASGMEAVILPRPWWRAPDACPPCTCGRAGGVAGNTRGGGRAGGVAGNTRGGGRVVGGSVAGRGALPWLSAVARGSERPTCGATLVSDRHLITAAHCVDGVEANDISAVVGAYALSEAEARRVTNIVQHPNFDPYTFDYDIAVLTLEEAITGDALIPACLPEEPAEQEGSEVLEGRAAMVAGWGQTEEKGPLSDLPQQVTVRVWPWSSCINAGYGKRRLTDRMICAGFHDGGMDACQGDSGGPLMLSGPNQEMTLIGVVSWGRGCARPDYPGVYARIDRFLPFIKTNIRSGCQCKRPSSY